MSKANETWRLQTYLYCVGVNWRIAHCFSCNCRAIRLPEGEQFSELYLLGPSQMAENYPSNIAGRPELLGLCKRWKPFRIISLLRIICKAWQPNRSITKCNPWNTKPPSTPLRIPIFNPRQQELDEPLDFFSFKRYNPSNQFTNQHPTNKRRNT